MMHFIYTVLSSWTILPGHFTSHFTNSKIAFELIITLFIYCAKTVFCSSFVLFPATPIFPPILVQTQPVNEINSNMVHILYAFIFHLTIFSTDIDPESRCGIIREENAPKRYPDKRFYHTGVPEIDNYVKISYRKCGGCHARYSNCLFEYNSDLDYFDYRTKWNFSVNVIPMTSLIDSSVKIDYPLDKSNTLGLKYSASTTQEFLFKYFFNYTGKSWNM